MTYITRRQPLQWMFASLLAASLVACGGGGDSGPNMNVDASGVSTFDSGTLAITLSTYQLQTVSAAEAGCGVAHLGDRSVALRTTIVDAGHCVATCESVMVAIDTQTRRSAALPQEIRDLLTPYRIHAGAQAEPG